MNTVLLLTFLSYFVQGQQFRFDYEWVEGAGGWLKYHAVPSVWEEARLRCHAEGAVLASPLTNQLKSAIVSFVKKQRNPTPTTIFTGVHATFSKGDYASIEGMPLLRMAITWAPSEPDNYENAESCLAMSTTAEGEMADTRCSEVLPYVCYKKITQLTINECGTSDPAYERVFSSCYKFHSRPLVWSEAYMTCVAEGGYLAVINNQAEMETMKRIFDKNPPNTVGGIYKDSLSIGFHDWGSRGARFMTIHGDNLESVYHSWAEGEPNNATNGRSGDFGQYCGSMVRSGLLDDCFCNVPAAFMCEMEPNSLLDGQA